MSKRCILKGSGLMGASSILFLLSCGSSTTLQVEYNITSGSSEPDLVVKMSMASDGSTKEDVVLEGGQKFGGAPNAILGCAKALGIIDSTNGNGGAVDSGGIDGSTCLTELGTYLSSLNISAGLSPPHTAGRMTLITEDVGYVFVLTFFNLAAGTRCVHLAGAEVRNKQFYIQSTGQASTSLTYTASSTGMSGAVTSADTEKCFSF